MKKTFVDYHVLSILFKTVGKNGNEPSRCEERGREILLSEVVVEVSVDYVEQTVHLEEKNFDFGHLFIEQVGDSKSLYDDHKCFECYLCVVKHHYEETCNVVHTLTVLDFGIVESVRTQHV